MEPPFHARTLRVAALRLLGLCVLAAGCQSPPPPLPEWQEGEGHRWRELLVDEGEGSGFTLLPGSETGIEFANRMDRQTGLENEHLFIGSGVALGDVDGDDRVDIYVTRLQGPNALYRNLGGWRFREVAAETGVALPDRYSTGATLADLDGDGDLDLLVSTHGEPNVVFENDGSGRFSDVTDEAGLDSPLAGTTMAVADVDGDGDLDVYQANYKRKSAHDALKILERSSGEGWVRQGDSLALTPEYREHFRVTRVDGRVVREEYAEPDLLYLNDGSGRFEPVPWTNGAFLDEEGRPLEEAPALFGLSARFYDVDADGDPDLYVCNDFQDPDQFWINQGDGTFRASDPLALRTTSHASMSVDFADLDRDGHVDFFVADMMARTRDEELRKRPLHDVSLRRPIGVLENRPQIGQNTLFRNRGDGTFAQVATMARVSATGWTWGSVFVDVDLDGYEDLLVANGHALDTQDADITERIQRQKGQMRWVEAKSLYPELLLENMAFRNRGEFSFEEVGESWGFGVEADISHGMAPGDLDNDGDQDVVVNRLGSELAVFRNDAAAPRLAVRLAGEPPNTRGVGARVTVSGGGLPEQEKQMTAGGLYLSSPEPAVSFAAGEASRLNLEVVWPDGRVSRVEGVRPGRLYEIRHAGAHPPDSTAGEPSSGVRDPADGDEPTVYFRDVSRMLQHRHPESPFEDYLRQLLLPLRLSRLGPGVSWIDVDLDGDPDLVVPPGRGGEISYLRNDGGAFRTVGVEENAGGYDRTAALPPPGTGDGFVVGQSSYEAAGPDEARRLPAALRVGSRAGTVDSLLPGHLHAAGPLSMADVDLDGDLDLFLGGRTIPTVYPMPATSRLFRNEEGRFVHDEANADLLSDLGLVSGSVFSDLDGDGDPDLLLAVEWGPPRVLVNEGGRFRDATAEWGVSELHGRWNGVATGDLNGDGRPDAVLTSWGRNLHHRPEEGRPLLAYYGDFDGNGQWEVVLAQEAPDGSAVHPLERYERIRRAMFPVARRFGSFDAYSTATMEELLANVREAPGRTGAVTYDHHALLNTGRGFRALPLPRRTQEAPSFGAVVADFDGDGHEDVFLSQNFFPTEPFTPRLDAGVGLWLRGDGSGALEPVTVPRAGVRAFGDQRGAAVADYDGDGRIDLAVGQNGGETKLFRNVGARPGLRVQLVASGANPRALGASMRVVYPDGRGPAREIQAGSGYWSVNGAVQILGLRAEPEGVWVRWPGGDSAVVRLSAGQRDVTIRR